MKTKFKGLALTAMLLSGSSMVMADNGNSIVGDLPGYGEDAYFHEDAAYAEGLDTYADEDAAYDDANYDGQVSPVAHAEQSVVTRSPRRNSASAHATAYAPVSASQMRAASFHGGGDCGCGSTSCGGGCEMEMMAGDCGCGSSSCGGGCSMGSCGPKNRMGKLFGRSGCQAWGTFETLLWFVEPRDTVPLIIGSPTGTVPALSEDNTSILFGGEGDTDLSVGGRADVGFWLNENIGVGGRFWALDESSDGYRNNPGDPQSVAISFFDTDSPAIEGGLLVDVDGLFDGTVSVDESLEIWAAEAYARMRFACTKNSQLDFIGGFSHFEIDNDLVINTNVVNEVASGANPIGFRRTLVDRFETENEFNGGQLGFEMMMNRGCWSVRSLTKVHLGNMSQTITRRGGYARQIPGVVPVTGAGGVLIDSDDVGSLERDVFAFAPEANFKLAYKFRPNVSFSVGYSFLYFDNVALSGDLIDRNRDGSRITTNTPDDDEASVANLIDSFTDSSLWVHGVDLGVAIDF